VNSRSEISARVTQCEVQTLCAIVQCSVCKPGKRVRVEKVM
jgi:hypothetical protein